MQFGCQGDVQPRSRPDCKSSWRADQCECADTGSICTLTATRTCSQDAGPTASDAGALTRKCAQIPAVQLFLAVINVVLVLQRLPCATSQLACMPVILAFCLLALEVRLGSRLSLSWNCHIPAGEYVCFMVPCAACSGGACLVCMHCPALTWGSPCCSPCACLHCYLWLPRSKLHVCLTTQHRGSEPDTLLKTWCPWC